MHKFLTLFAAFSLALAASGSRASAEFTSVNEVIFHGWAENIAALDLINWKVGDTMQYNVGLGGLGNVGTSTKSVTKDEGTAIWVRQALKLMGKDEIIEILINKADGKILKMLRNGQEQAIPDDKLEIIETDYADITVPAGKFKTLHIIAKSKQSSKIELWANPQETVMDGGIKQVIATQFGPLSMELTAFSHGQ